MKIWLDDRRPPPNSSWVWLRTPEEVIEALQTGGVEELSRPRPGNLYLRRRAHRL
jgi:Cyclic-phosphate processing Receiver domain